MAHRIFPARARLRSRSIGTDMGCLLVIRFRVTSALLVRRTKASEIDKTNNAPRTLVGRGAFPLMGQGLGTSAWRAPLSPPPPSGRRAENRTLPGPGAPR